VDKRRIYPLRNAVKHYAWGSHTAIAALRGEPTPSPQPEAELWVGAHPAGVSHVATPEGDVPLDRFIAADPAGVLGPQVAARFGPRLPFLLKLLAAAQPLSIQAHPSPEQARAGFARENAAGVPLDAPERCYRDDQAKPELICALTPFQALIRFRPAPEVRARLARLEAPELAPLLRAGETAPEDALRGLFAGWMSLPADARQRVLARASERARRDPDADLAWVARLAEAYPGDAGALAPLFLNRVTLAPGEALFLPAGELHSYLEGFGVEIMGSSDNVLRGGLTPKHVDVPELLRVLRFEGGPVRPLRPEPAGSCEARYRTAAPEFELSVIRLAQGALEVGARRGVEILLCTEGGGALVDAASGSRLPIRAGEAVLVPAALPAYRVEGSLALQRAAVGAPSASA
jgi:mannose-6-phosphate isomerase